MTLTARYFNPELDYQEICGWWRYHKWPEIPLNSLAKVGVVILDNDMPIVVAWIYRSDSDLGWMEWMVSNPKAEKIARNEAINTLIDQCALTAKNMGIRVLFTSVRVPRLIKRLVDAGFTVNDTSMTNLTKVI